ncbi:phosphoesterase, PA-phosphatase related [Alloactinosynnema sp. L-07]|uniref:phosphatase PAP2 family protein n=1 Tax=Alloactinosynnema sp. L-07 TaxID=1653480 RepID=UPI00065F0326|nr:phosphatase PAP2 family protein [Alloactinosynnema sp. L-07]CRK55033.1 phosphoesterase, PA-phosphatase related [Alloactinosynnema sp. L-07]
MTTTISRPARHTSAPVLLGGAAACLVGLILTYLLFVRTAAGQWADGLLLSDYRGLPRSAEEVLAATGDVKLWLVLVTVVLVIGALGGRWWRGVAGVGVILGAVGVARLLKATLSRPDLDIVGSTTHNSFASGHVAAAAGLLVAFLLVVPAAARPWIAVPGGLSVAAVAWATVDAGWHRPSDVVGAVLIAAALALVVAAVTRVA